MGNQARFDDNTTVFSTSTRNFNNPMGKGAQVYLGSIEERSLFSCRHNEERSLFAR
jgi:aconitase B